MLISFFEEFPTRESLEKLRLVKWPMKLYLAAPSLEVFRRLKGKIKNKFVKEVVYWPVLSKNEGYWFSPFSERKAMLRIFKELEGKKVPVMLDLELPTVQNPFLFFSQFFNFFRNRRLIHDFVKEHSKVYTAEYFPLHGILAWIFNCLCLHLDPQKYGNKMIKMVYTSMHAVSDAALEKYLQEAQTRFGQDFLLGLGVLAPGVMGNEPRLSPGQLKRDVTLAAKAGVREVVVFRLAGLEKEYAAVLRDGVF